MATTEAEVPAVELQIACDAPELPGSAELGRWVAAAATAADRALPPGAALTVRIVDADESRRLNQDYRGQDWPTNVLSFPAELHALPGLPAGDAAHLGDLVLCAPVVAAEAVDQGKPARDHWLHLLVHGFLHLLGFDHQNSDEADIMEALEIRILSDQGIENPYEDRRLS